MTKENDPWKKRLTPEEYAVLRQKGTEPPFTGKLNFEKRSGTYLCKGCKTPLFHSSSKYDSGSGWPSFFDALNEDALTFVDDFSHGLKRTEVLCTFCGCHLGHLFPDGPEPTGLRYCLNSLSLSFKPKNQPSS